MFAILIVLRYLLIAGIVVLILLIIYKRFLKKMILKQGHLPKYAAFAGDAVYYSEEKENWLVQISIPKEQEVSINILDDSDRPVLMVQKGMIGLGDHFIPFSTEKIGVGMFVCRLESEGQKAERYFRLD